MVCVHTAHRENELKEEKIGGLRSLVNSEQGSGRQLGIGNVFRSANKTIKAWHEICAMSVAGAASTGKSYKGSENLNSCIIWLVSYFLSKKHQLISVVLQWSSQESRGFCPLLSCLRKGINSCLLLFHTGRVAIDEFRFPL